MRATIQILRVLLSSSVGVVCGSSATARAPSAILERPAKGNGSSRLVDATIRQEARIYKRTAQGDLSLYLFFPRDCTAHDRRPAVVFFFGGGWKNGTPAQFFAQAEYFASRGLVTALAEYRILNTHGTTPDRCIADAKSAIRWLRCQARELGIDPDRLVGAGGSAGAHLAAATALIDGFDEPVDDASVSCRPNALLLFNPPLNLSEKKIRDADGQRIEREFSPTLWLKHGAPPTVLFYGASDPLMQQGVEFLEKSTQLGIRCELFYADGQTHGFFNHPPWLNETVIQADKFLRSLGYILGAPTLRAGNDSAALTAMRPRKSNHSQ